MKTFAFVFVCALLALFAAPAMADGGTAPEASTLTASQTLEQILTPAASADSDLEEACDSPLLDADAKAACPGGAPTCYRDSDCDAYCGGAGFGVCQGHWTGCCGLCAG